MQRHYIQNYYPQSAAPIRLLQGLQQQILLVIIDPNVNNSEVNDGADASDNVGISVSTAQAITSN